MLHRSHWHSHYQRWGLPRPLAGAAVPASVTSSLTSSEALSNIPYARSSLPRSSLANPTVAFSRSIWTLRRWVSTDGAGLEEKRRASETPLCFDPPTSLTEEGLSFAACPMCGIQFHMCVMLRHITSTHREENVEHWTRLCHARLALYERVSGVPLSEKGMGRQGAAQHGNEDALSGQSDAPQPATAAAAVFPTAGAVGVAPDATNAVLHKTDRSLRPYIPTVHANGTYTCNWCTVMDVSFPSRDAFLLHVAREHPAVDFDLAESLAPRPPTSARRALREDASSAALQKEGSATAQVNGNSWTPAPRPDGEVSSFHGPSQPCQRRDIVRSGDGPTRRLPGVRTVVEDTRLRMTRTDVRQVGVTVERASCQSSEPVPLTLPRKKSAVSSPSPTSSALADETSQGDAPLLFDGRCFPCELCLRVFVSELNLLQHLEGKHGSLTYEGTAGNGASTGAPSDNAAASGEEGLSGASSAPAKRASRTGEAVSSPLSSLLKPESPSTATTAAAMLCVSCDFCSFPKKVFKTASALFSHIRFRHPGENAVDETERMVAEQQGVPRFVCLPCSVAFRTGENLSHHQRVKHDKEIYPSGTSVSMPAVGARGTAAPLTSKKAVGLTLPPVTVKTQYWCAKCDKGFASAPALYRHVRKQHDFEARVYPCPACKRSFEELLALDRHIAAYHRNFTLSDMGLQVSVKCRDCGRHLIDYEALHEHAVRHHGKSSGAPVRSFQAPSSVGDRTHDLSSTTTQAPVFDTGDLVDGASVTPKAPLAPRKVSRRKKVATEVNASS